MKRETKALEALDVSLRRECIEEIGTDIEIGHVLFVREYIGKNHQYAATDSHFHIVEVMFACRVPDDYTAHVGTAPDDEQVDVTWLPIAELDKLRFFPSALKSALEAQSDVPIYLGDVN